MKHSIIQRAAQLLLGTVSLAVLAGCPIDATQSDPPTTLAGTYWVEHRDGQLAIFELPAYRGEDGTWYTFETDPPDWYTGSALYEVNDDGSWSRLTMDETLTLDEVMQLHDPAPRVDPSAD